MRTVRDNFLEEITADGNCDRCYRVCTECIRAQEIKQQETDNRVELAEKFGCLSAEARQALGRSSYAVMEIEHELNRQKEEFEVARQTLVKYTKALEVLQTFSGKPETVREYVKGVLKEGNE